MKGIRHRCLVIVWYFTKSCINIVATSLGLEACVFKSINVMAQKMKIEREYL